ncbi:hypothetical protein PLESTB_000494900 [Pleodorina starrii]|uniref:Uncharacterized protein n=1 Tax=Pleodorina starrii TaxID=330485 RepID=A0A9W6BFZ4_9CHLO|nr:hypothetical protein PLESTM_000366300 [Pleodorina starrii]GLC51369.1 hypothetical protein PLESTB_000494900 [Pleodorina starrii]GLC63734.1 hypothetical protein PLESTF_000068400 [Pleodorina starrii]
MASPDKLSESKENQTLSRPQRVGRYKVWLLQKRLAELSAQIEAAVLEARQLISWKQSYQPLTVAELTDEDRRILEHNHRIRLAEVVQKQCTGALKTITQHKWAFPFNSPVDTARFPDYPKVISTPMDFSTIKARQDSGYYRDPKDWWADVMLVFSNAKRYNAPGSDCYLMAQTLQEVSEEKYDKVIAPRVAEEASVTLREEVHLKKKRAELVNMQISEAMDAQCAVLFNLMAELHAAIREAKSLAASLCEPLTLEEKQALAATIQGLPTAQLESIVAFVASRHPPSVSTSEVAPGAGGGPAQPSRKVQLNLGRYDPLLLRQLQHLVSTCTAARQQQQGQGQGLLQPPQRMVSPVQRAAPGDRPGGSTSASPGTSPGPGAAQPVAGDAAGAAQAPAASPSGAKADGELGQATAAGQTQQQPSGSGAAAAVGAPAAAAAAEGAAAPGQPSAGPTAAAASPAAPPAPAPAAAAASAPAVPSPPPFSSTQRNISDVVTNATASGISVRAGIKWPGLAVGAGVRPRARALLSLHLDGPSSAGEMLAACPLPQPPLSQQRPQPQAQAGPPRLTGVKRRTIQSLMGGLG